MITQINNSNVFRILLLTLMLFSCNQNDNLNNVIDDPLVVVVKFESAQSYRDYETAKQFFNPDSVYGKLAKDSNISAEDLWKQSVDFNYFIGNSSSKFTNSFPFHKYKIVENNNGIYSTVQFISENSESKNKEIIYTLNLSDKSKWIITHIEYIKSNDK